MHYNSAHEKFVTQYGCQVLNHYGYSFCIFSSDTDAINCSLEIQKEFKNKPVVPLRIGLQIGEVFLALINEGLFVSQRKIGKGN